METTNNEIIETEVIEEQVINTEVDNYDDTDESGSGKFGLAGILTGVLAIGAGALIWKNKEKIKQKKIEKKIADLEKLGYVVCEQEDKHEDDFVDDFDEEEKEISKEEDKK